MEPMTSDNWQFIAGLVVGVILGQIALHYFLEWRGRP